MIDVITLEKKDGYKILLFTLATLLFLVVLRYRLFKSRTGLSPWTCQPRGTNAPQQPAQAERLCQWRP